MLRYEMQKMFFTLQTALWTKAKIAEEKIEQAIWSNENEKEAEAAAKETADRRTAQIAAAAPIMKHVLKEAEKDPEHKEYMRKWNQTLCREGKYCEGDGPGRDCPAGKFGSTRGMAAENDCTDCANGKAMGMVIAITPQLDPVVNESSDTVTNTTTGNNCAVMNGDTASMT